MGKAARAIIIEKHNILVMRRNKQGDQYYTLVGGQVNGSETLEQGLVREVREEAGLEVVAARLVFHEPHPAPYNEQYIFVCQVAPHSGAALQNTSEEAMMNKFGFNTHTLAWVPLAAFERLAFRTPQLQRAIIEGLNKGFPASVVRI